MKTHRLAVWTLLAAGAVTCALSGCGGGGSDGGTGSALSLPERIELTRGADGGVFTAPVRPPARAPCEAAR